MRRGWSEIRADLLPYAGNIGDPRAQAIIVDAVRRGDFVQPPMADIQLTHSTLPVTGVVRATVGALELGRPGDSQRVMVSHRSQQAIADLLGLLMPTPDVIDAIAQASPVHTEPKLAPVSSTLEAQRAHHEALESSAGFDNVKSWVNHPRLLSPQGERFGKQTAINYGWLTSAAPAPPGEPGPKPAVSIEELSVWQQPGGAHDVSHTDRSQLAIGLVDPDMTVITAGVPLVQRTEQIAIDPILHPLISRSGPTPLRHPFLPECVSLAEGGACPAASTPSGGGLAPVSSKLRRASLALARFAPAAFGASVIAYLVIK